MNNFKKLLICVVFTAILLISTARIVSASNLPNLSSDKYITCYPLNKSDRIYAVNAENRYIDPGDECYITAINDAWVYVSYPTAKGRDSEWFKRENFSVADMAYANFPTITAPRKVTTFRNSTGEETFGYLDKGDLCYVLTKMNGRTQLVYPVPNGYKMGWVNSSEIFEGTNTAIMSIHSTLDISKVIDVDSGSHADGTNILLYSEHGGKNQGFETIPVGKYFVIVNTESGKALDVQGGVSRSGINVQLYTVNYSDAQLWEILGSGESKTYYLKNKLGYFLDVCGGIATDCTNIWVYEGNNSAAQKFKFKPLSVNAGRGSNTYLLFINGFANEKAAANTYSQLESILVENKLNNANIVRRDSITYDCTSTGISSSDFESALNDRMASASSNDTAFIYLAAHGTINIFGLGNQTYAYNDLVNLLKDTNCGKFVLIIENCQSSSVITWIEELNDSDKSRFIVLASSDFQSTGQFYEKKFFLFGKALSAGLSKNGDYLNADWNKNREITVKEIEDYVKIYIENTLLEWEKDGLFDFKSVWKDQTPVCYAANEHEVIYQY